MWYYYSGPNHSLLKNCNSVGKIFDIAWKGISEHILETTLKRNDSPVTSVKDINLYLASLLVVGLTPHPEVANYFMQDERGIFGSTWMQNHCTRDKWHAVNAHIHFDPVWLTAKVRDNVAEMWNPYQEVVVDEMMVPFTGRWKHIQHVKGKPHNTGNRFLSDFDIKESNFMELLIPNIICLIFGIMQGRNQKTPINQLK